VERCYICCHEHNGNLDAGSVLDQLTATAVGRPKSKHSQSHHFIPDSSDEEDEEQVMNPRNLEVLVNDEVTGYQPSKGCKLRSDEGYLFSPAWWEKIINYIQKFGNWQSLF
jgi:hypothetical protein